MDLSLVGWKSRDHVAEDKLNLGPYQASQVDRILINQA